MNAAAIPSTRQTIYRALPRDAFAAWVLLAGFLHLVLLAVIAWQFERHKKPPLELAASAAASAAGLGFVPEEVNWVQPTLMDRLPPSLTHSTKDDPESDLVLPGANRPTPVPEAKPEPKPAPAPKPQPVLTPVPKPQPQPQPKPKPIPVSKPEPKLTPAPAPKPAEPKVTPALKPAVKPKPALKPEPKPVVAKAAPIQRPQLTPAPAPPPQPTPAPKPEPAPAPTPTPVKAKPISPGPIMPARPDPSPPKAAPLAGGTSRNAGTGQGGTSSTGTGTGAHPPSSANDLSGFHQRVRTTYMSRWQQPRGLVSSGRKFRVRTEITVDRAGNVVRARIVQGTGNALMDQSVRDTLSQVHFIAPLPGGVTSPTYTVTLNFDI